MTTNCKPTRIGSIGAIIDDLAEAFDNGTLTGLIVITLSINEEGERIMNFHWDGFKSYPEQLGACDMMKECMARKAQEESE